MMEIRYPNITGRTPEDRQKQMENYLRYLTDQLNWSQKKAQKKTIENIEPTTVQSVPTGKAKDRAGFVYSFAGSKAPAGFLLCDGTAYSRTAYSELFAAIGITYGAGDGSTTFNVPNYAGRVLVGSGGGYTLGATGGEATHTLTIDEMPSHSHTQKLISRQLNGADGSTSTTGYNANVGWWTSMHVHISSTDTVGAGGSQPHNNMQPYAVANYIISTGKT